MATLREIIEAFDAYVQSADGLEITCNKGYPDFRRLNLAPPIAALFYGGSNAGVDVARRVGASASAVVVTLGIYASDEVNLFSLAEKLQAMRGRSPIALIAGDDSQPVQAYIGEDERAAPDPDDPKELRHFTECPVVLVYE